MKPIKIIGIDERAQKTLYDAAVILNTNAQKCMENVCNAIDDMAATIEKQLELLDVDLPDLDLPRSPEEIKKDIKHEKNPMRLKQLNKELNESYKVYNKRRKYENKI